ncbi:MAG: exo-alpha-sialidase [Bacteroidota bacterium]
MLRCFFTALIVVCVMGGRAQVTVFSSDEGGYAFFRIPAIVGLSRGDLLAFAEGRVNDSGDFGNIDLVMKRSRDNCRTWSSLQLVVDQTNVQAGNPAPVVDLLDPEHPKGVGYLFYNTGNIHENEVRKGNGVREVWYVRSMDQGLTWSAPVNITLQTHRPNLPTFNEAYSFSEDWRSYANTPGHAMQFQKGRYKGRIYVAANHSFGPPQDRFRDYRAHGFFSDDHGKSFQLGATLTIPGSNESMATELSDSRMLMSVRNQSGTPRVRIVAFSSDGGMGWDTAYSDIQLPDPVCQGSILTVGYRKGKAIVASCNAADTVRRANLSVKVSRDEGRSWTTTILVEPFAAYSDMVKLEAHRIGVLYERNNYKEIVFKEIEWK